MITCSLIKPESTFDQIKKTFTKLKPTDAALLATAIVLSARYALVNYDEETFCWPEDYNRLTNSLLKELEIIQAEANASLKKVSKASTPEEEIFEINLNLIPNYAAGEKILADREDLKTIFADILEEGLEYLFAPGDVGWQWALDRAAWGTLSDGSFNQKVKFNAEFPEISRKSKTSRKK